MSNKNKTQNDWSSSSETLEDSLDDFHNSQEEYLNDLVNDRVAVKANPVKLEFEVMTEEKIELLNNKYGEMIIFFQDAVFSDQDMQNFLTFHDIFSTASFSFSKTGSFIQFCRSHGITSDNIGDYRTMEITNLINEELSLYSASNKNVAVISYKGDVFISPLRETPSENAGRVLTDTDFLKDVEGRVAKKVISRLNVPRQGRPLVIDEDRTMRQRIAGLKLTKTNKIYTGSSFGMMPTLGVSKDMCRILLTMYNLRGSGALYYGVSDRWDKGDYSTLQIGSSGGTKWNKNFATYITIAYKGYTNSWVEYVTERPFHEVVDMVAEELYDNDRKKALTELASRHRSSVLKPFVEHKDELLASLRDSFGVYSYVREINDAEVTTKYARIQVTSLVNESSLECAMGLLTASGMTTQSYSTISADYELYCVDPYATMLLAVDKNIKVEIPKLENPIVAMREIKKIIAIASITNISILLMLMSKYSEYADGSRSFRKDFAEKLESRNGYYGWLEETITEYSYIQPFRRITLSKLRKSVYKQYAMMKLRSPPLILASVAQMGDADKDNIMTLVDMEDDDDGVVPVEGDNSDEEVKEIEFEGWGD